MHDVDSVTEHGIIVAIDPQPTTEHPYADENIVIIKTKSAYFAVQTRAEATIDYATNEWHIRGPVVLSSHKPITLDQAGKAAYDHETNEIARGNENDLIGGIGSSF